MSNFFHHSSRLISEVTLICVDCVNCARAIEILETCRSLAPFLHIRLLTSEPTDYPFARPIPPVRSGEDYSRFCIGELHRYFDTPHCLIVQHDGWIVNPMAWRDDWLDFDFMGCNTIWTEAGPEGKGGNGGFSLRSKRLMQSVAGFAASPHPEDYVISLSGRRALEALGFVFAPRRIQEAFGCEFTAYRDQFGHHRGLFLPDAPVRSLTRPDIVHDVAYDFSNDHASLGCLSLAESGQIQGATHPNESRWEFRDGHLSFFDEKDEVTTDFYAITSTGRLVGRFRNCVNHYLRPSRNAHEVILGHFHKARNTASDIFEHMETLRRYAEECHHVTEMGVRDVVSTWAFLASRPKKLVCIDSRPCPVDQARGLAEEAGIMFEFRLGDTTADDFAIEPTDLLFIDTLHVYDQLKKELDRHAACVRQFIIMHDTTTFGEIGEPIDGSPNARGLWPAIEEFLESHCDWQLRERFTNNNGLTVLSRSVE